MGESGERVESQIAIGKIQISVGHSVVFHSQKAKEDFLQQFGGGWAKFINRTLKGQLDGTYEVLPSNIANENFIGSSFLGQSGMFLVRPFDGICRDAFLAEIPLQFISIISTRLTEIFGKDGMDGTAKGYAWYEKTYGITEEEDNKWLDLVGFYEGTLEEDPSFAHLSDSERAEVLKFVADKEEHFAFLVGVSARLGRGTKKYPRPR